MQKDTKSLLTWAKENNYVSATLKNSLLVSSLTFWIVGGLFAAVGGWHISQKDRYASSNNFAIYPGATLATLGCLIFIISAFGVLGSLRQNICYLRVYKVCLVAVLVLEICSGLIGFAFWPEVKKKIDSNVSNAILEYTDDPFLRGLIDTLQRDLKCCGSLSVDDWDSNPYYTCRSGGSYRSCGVPWSCCHTNLQMNPQCGYKVRKNRSKREMGTQIQVIGCLDKAFEFTKNNMMVIGGLAIGWSLAVIGIIFMVNRLVKQIRRQATEFYTANETFRWIKDSSCSTASAV